MEDSTSKTSLDQKLRILAGNRVLLLNAPSGFRETLGSLPEGAFISQSGKGEFDVILGFFATKAELDSNLKVLKSAMGEKSILWVAYPKGTSKMPTDLNRDILHGHLDKKGLQGVSLIALNETWSAMRFKKRS